MYSLKITLRYPNSLEDAKWCTTLFFRTKEEVFNYIENNFNCEDPDSKFNFELTSPSGIWQSL
jgi:hypothetical protein